MKILVIEDEHKIANTLKRGLEQESYSVEVAYDGKDGLSKALSGSHDLVIVDQALSGSHEGLQIVQAMRDHKIHTPVLLLIDKPTGKSKSVSQANGADDSLLKPFAIGELLMRVRVLTNPTHDPSTELLTYNDLVLDPANFTVTHGKKSIELTHREFALLEFLMRNPGRVLTKDMITQYVWDYDADILPNTVEVYMGYIRNKVEKPFGKDALVRTRRGFGYIFGEA